MLLRLTSAALAVLLPSLALAGEVHVVALGTGGDFSTLQAAVDVAVDGDTILVNGGTYPTLGGASDAVIAGKALNIAQGVGGEPWLRGEVTVRDLAPSQEVHIQGLRVRQLRIEDCQGEVLLEDMNLGAGLFTQADLVVLGSPKVAASRSTFRGFDGWSVCGGQCNNGADGGPAVVVTDSRLRLYDCDLWGGPGEDGAWLPCGVGGNGGDGLVVTDVTSRVRHLDCHFQGGFEGWGGCGNGWIGSPTNAPAGTLVPLTTPVTVLAGPGTAPAGGTADLTIVGAPGTSLLLVTTTDLFHRDLIPSVGTLHMLWPFTVQSLPPIPPQGVLTHTLQLPSLPPGQARWRLMQVVHQVQGSRFLGPPRGLTVVQ